MKIEITSSQTRLFSGTSAKTNREYKFYKQAAYLHLPHQLYPIEIELSWNNEQEVAPPGMYILAPESYSVDRNKRIQVNPVLVAAPTQPAAAGKPAAA